MSNSLPERRWVFALTDLTRERGSPNLGLLDLLELMDKMREISPRYNGLVLHDTWIGAIPEQEQQYRDNLERIRDVAADPDRPKIEIIPVCIPSSGSLLSAFPNLAEGIPVRDSEFTIEESDDGLIAVIKDKGNHVQNGKLEPPADEWTWDRGPDSPVRLLGAPGSSGTLEFEAVAADSIEVFAKQLITLKLWHQYEFSFHARSSKLFKHLWKDNDDNNKNQFFYNLDGSPFQDRDKKKPLTRIEFAPRKACEWEEFRIVFNTLEYENVDVGFYFELNRPAEDEGWKVQVRDVSVREVGGFNLLRREGCPLTVVGADDTSYKEPREQFQGHFKEWTDPMIVGGFDYRTHDEENPPDEKNPAHLPPPIRLIEGSGIENAAQPLKVSYYHGFPMGASGTNMDCCMYHEDTYQRYQQEVVLTQQLLGAKTWIMNHDEFRVVGHCKLCRAIVQDRRPARRLLEYNITRCTQKIQMTVPDAEIFTMNDMFDPYHNALKPENKYSYFPHVNGSLEDAFEDIPSGVKIYNWNQHETKLSLEKFESRQQVWAGYYDNDHEFEKRTREHLNYARQSGVIGVTYATYENRYCQLVRFAELIKEVWETG